MKIRKSARAIIVNEKNEILLEKFEFPDIVGNKVLWVTPGGGIQDFETPSEALQRELNEELGIVVQITSDPIFKKDVHIEGKSGTFVSHEMYYKICIQNNTIITTCNMTKEEQATFRGFKWWRKEELNNIQDFAPHELLNYF